MRISALNSLIFKDKRGVKFGRNDGKMQNLTRREMSITGNKLEEHAAPKNTNILGVLYITSR